MLNIIDLKMILKTLTLPRKKKCNLQLHRKVSYCWNQTLFSYLIYKSSVLYFVTKNEWHLTYASVWLLFWFGPFTPLIPLCIAITFGVKKLLKIKKKRKQEKQEKEDNEKNQLN